MYNFDLEWLYHGYFNRELILHGLLNKSVNNSNFIYFNTEDAVILDRASDLGLYDLYSVAHGL